MPPSSRRSTAIRWTSRRPGSSTTTSPSSSTAAKSRLPAQMAPIYGVAEAQRRNAQSYWVFLSHAAAYGKVPGNACFFFSCDDMTPQVNNPGWVAALEDYIKSRDLGAPEQLQWDVADTRIQFPAGVSVFNIDWGDVGPDLLQPRRLGDRRRHRLRPAAGRRPATMITPSRRGWKRRTRRPSSPSAAGSSAWPRTATPRPVPWTLAASWRARRW